MKPAPFAYHLPRTLDEATALLADSGSDAKALAGGQSLIPAMNFRLATPAVLVDLNAIPSLDRIEHHDGTLRLGAMVRHRALERSEVIATHAPLVRAAIPFVGHAAIRTRGTIGGSLSHADPAAELPAVMLALDARFTLRGSDGSRVVPVEAFFTGLFATAVGPGELLTAIEIPIAGERTGVAFDEVARRHGDYALAGAAAAVRMDAEGRCASLRLALLSVGDRPMLAARAARVLVGERPAPEAIRAAAEASAVEDIDPPGDIHASSRYRRHLAAVLMRRVLSRAFDAVERR